MLILLRQINFISLILFLLSDIICGKLCDKLCDKYLFLGISKIAD